MSDTPEPWKFTRYTSPEYQGWITDANGKKIIGSVPHESGEKIVSAVNDVAKLKAVAGEMERALADAIAESDRAKRQFVSMSHEWVPSARAALLSYRALKG